jgi:hypothetical protein
MGSSVGIRVPGGPAHIEMTVQAVSAKDIGHYILLANRREYEPSEFPENAVDNLEHIANGRPSLWLGWFSSHFEDWPLR